MRITFILNDWVSTTTTAFPTHSTDFERLVHEHRALLAHLGSVQTRCSRIVAEQAEEIQKLEGETMRLRAAVMVRDTALAFAREDRALLEAAIPGLPRRAALATRVEALLSRIQDLMRERLRWQSRGPTAPPPVPVNLLDKAALCVGQDTSGATLARQVVEMAGGHFSRHEGDELGDNAALEASLVAADLVICQTGCVSHNAYWRVQDHCKRTGKQCVLVAQPQAMQQIQWAEATTTR